jgi:hypothetical protein
MVLIQLLLPTNTSGRADDQAPLAQTRRELTDRFKGLTASTCISTRERNQFPSVLIEPALARRIPGNSYVRRVRAVTLLSRSVAAR